MADGQETEIVQIEPGTLSDVLESLKPNVGVEPVSEAEGEPDAPETPEAEQMAPTDEGEELEDETEVQDANAEVEEAEEEDAEEDEAEDEEELATVTVGGIEFEVDEEGAAAIEELQEQAASAADHIAKAEMVEQQARRNKMDADQLAIMEDELRLDPVGYLAEKIGPDLRAAVVEDLLLDDQVWRIVVEKVEDWSADDSQRRIAAEARRANRAEFKNQLEERRVAVRTGRENAWELRDKVTEMGQNLPERRRQVWERAALSRLTDYVRRAEQAGKPIHSLDPKDLDRVLADEIDAFGINAGEAPAEPGGKKKPVKDAGEKFRAKTRKRKQVTSTAPAGAGAGPARREQFKEMSLGDALSTLTRQTGR